MIAYLLFDSMQSDLKELAPRLWPFLYHSSSSVRGSALATLATLTSASHSAKDKGENQEVEAQVDIKQESSSDCYENVTAKVEEMAMEEHSEAEGSSKTDIKQESTNSHESATAEEKSPEAEENINKDNKMLVDEEKQDDKKIPLSDDQEIKKDEGSSQNQSIEKGKQKEEEMEKEKEEVKNEPENNQAYVRFPQEETYCGDYLEWLNPIIQPALTHIYQRALLETSEENIDFVFKVGNICIITVVSK